MAPKSIYFGLDAIGDITQIDRANSVSPGPNQTGPAYSVLDREKGISPINNGNRGRDGPRARTRKRG